MGLGGHWSCATQISLSVAAESLALRVRQSCLPHIKASDPAAFNSLSHSSGDRIPLALAGTRTLSIASSGLLRAYYRFTAKEKSAETAVWKLFKLFCDCSHAKPLISICVNGSVEALRVA
jgi:hypothetical protein